MSREAISVVTTEKGSDKLAFAAAAGGLLATVATGLACVGPLVAILLGIGGLGWLTQYAYLRVPASIVTGVLLAAGFYWAYRRPRGTDCKKRTRSRAIGRAILWAATALALAVNVFEYVIFPRLG